MTIVDRNKPEGDGWHWRPGGFVVVGALLFGAGFVYEFLASKMNSRALKLALGLAMTFSVLAIWVEVAVDGVRSEEHTSELQSLMRISYAVFCLKQKNNTIDNNKYRK